MNFVPFRSTLRRVLLIIIASIRNGEWKLLCLNAYWRKTLKCFTNELFSFFLIFLSSQLAIFFLKVIQFKGKEKKLCIHSLFKQRNFLMLFFFIKLCLYSNFINVCICANNNNIQTQTPAQHIFKDFQYDMTSLIKKTFFHFQLINTFFYILGIYQIFLKTSVEQCHNDNSRMVKYFTHFFNTS